LKIGLKYAMHKMRIHLPRIHINPHPKDHSSGDFKVFSIPRDERVLSVFSNFH
jgi:hypothetical protein